MKGKIFNALTKMKMSNVLGLFALTVATVAANRCCIIIYHQPDVPEKVKGLRKF